MNWIFHAVFSFLTWLGLSIMILSLPIHFSIAWWLA